MGVFIKSSHAVAVVGHGAGKRHRPVTDIVLSASTAADTATVGTVVGTATPTAPDGPLTSFVFSLTNSAGGKYAISSSTGVVTVASALAAGVDSITIQVADGSKLFSKVFAITVTGVVSIGFLGGTFSNATVNTPVGGLFATTPVVLMNPVWSITSQTGSHYTLVPPADNAPHSNHNIYINTPNPPSGPNVIHVQVTSDNFSTISQDISIPVTPVTPDTTSGPLTIGIQQTVTFDTQGNIWNTVFVVSGTIPFDNEDRTGHWTISNDPSGLLILGDDRYHSIYLPYIPTPGAYPCTITYSKIGQADSVLNTTINIVHDPVPTSVTFGQKVISTTAPVGTTVGTCTAVDQSGNYSWLMTNTAGGKYGISQTGVVAVVGALTVGTDTVTVQVIDTSWPYPGSNVNHTFSQDLAISVVQGNQLASTNMTMTVATNLTNFVISPTTPRAVGTPSVTGVTGTQQWTLQQLSGDPTFPLRYAINPNTGAVTAVLQLSAQTDVLTLSVTDGINACTRSFNVVVAGVVGPTIDVGPGFSDVARVSYAHFATLMSDAYEDVLATGGVNYAGMTIILHPSVDPNYYVGDNNGGRSHSRILVPFTLRGAPGGPRPRMGGTVGTASSDGSDYFGKGYLVLYDFDAVIENLEVSDCRDGANINGNLAGIRKELGTVGNVTFTNVYIHHCNNGFLGGGSSTILTMTDCEFANCGDAQFGHDHNVYINSGAEVVINNCLFRGAEQGHDFKSRAKKLTITNSRFVDTEIGRASYNLDIPDGGEITIDGCVFHKGGNGQNGTSLHYGGEFFHHWPVNTFTVTNSTFLNTMPNNFYPWGSPVAALNQGAFYDVTGVKSTGSLSNCSFFNYAAGRTAMGDTVNGYSAPTNTSPVTLTSMPALDLSRPGVGPTSVIVRPTWTYMYPADSSGANQGDNETQIFPDSNDIRIAHTATNGTTVASFSAYGTDYYAQLSVSGPSDPRIQPFTAPTWSLLAVTGQTAASGKYTINASTGVLKVGATPLTAGTDLLKIQVAQGIYSCTEWFYVTVT